MGIYDTIVLDELVECEDVVIDISTEIGSERYRFWQTKGLNPSLDMYAVLPRHRVTEEEQDDDTNTRLKLYRRHPPLIEWTNRNQGALKGTEDAAVIEDAHHWRNVRYTGTINMRKFCEDGLLYHLECSISNGIVDDVSLASEPEVTDVSYPTIGWENCIDTQGTDATYNGRSVASIGRDFYAGRLTDTDIPDEELTSVLKYYNSNMRIKNNY